jgi:hypothetical protein
LSDENGMNEEIRTLIDVMGWRLKRVEWNENDMEKVAKTMVEVSNAFLQGLNIFIYFPNLHNISL